MSSPTPSPEPSEPGTNAQGDLAVLREMPIFGAVPDRALLFLGERASRVEVPGGRWFFRQGDKGETMYVLRSGLVEVQRSLAGQTATLGRLGPGECFGEMALIDLYPRSASVRAVEDCVALAMTNALLYELYDRDPEPFTLIMMNLARELSRRLRSAEVLLFLRRDPKRHPHPHGADAGEIPYV
jgi:CRP/FNR family transcriptional regulator, cyclic AMP receptor protein